MSLDAIDWSTLRNVVFDTTFRDKKTFSLLEQADTKKDLECLFKLLSEHECKLWTY
jgi:hypothetical protein